jgi:glycosyltransferase involved in cell wall biosynthesis
MTRVAVLLPQVPFLEGGAEAHAGGLVRALEARRIEADLVTMPYKWYPREELLKQPLLWRMLDLTESDGRKIDLVVGTKFPSYCALHPNKVVWLIHQFRQIYDLWGTPYSDFAPTAEDEAVRERIRQADLACLGEARKVFTNARNTAQRLERFCGLPGEALYHPPPLEPLLRSLPPTEPGDFVLSVGRLDDLKRVELLLDAAAKVPGLEVRIAGSGPAREKLEARAAKLGLGSRARFLGRVPEEEVVALYRGCRAVWYAPFDEDYGYVTLEAFLAGRPVVTARDSGGILEFVRDGETGLVGDPDAGSLAELLGRLAADRVLAARLGAAGAEAVRDITWENACRRILEAGGLA